MPNYLSIDSLCTLLNGFAFKSEAYVDGGIRIIRIANVQKGYIEDAAPQFYPLKSLIDIEKYVLHENDLLVSLTGNVGRVGILDSSMLPAALNQRVACLRINDTSLLDLRYLYNYLNSDVFERACIEASNGVAQKNLSTEWLKKYQIPLPPIEEQKKIAATLDAVSDLIRLRKRQLEELDLLVKARFVELFDNGKYTKKTVDELCSEIVDCPHTTPRYEGELTNPAIRTSEIKQGYITWDSMRYVSDEEYEERVIRLRPQAGDIVYGREGTFGNAAILPKGYNFCLGQRVMLLRPNYSLCTSEYLLHAVISDDVYKQALEKNNASTVAHINVKDVKNFIIPLPPLSLQDEFALFVSHVESCKKIMQNATEKTTLLFSSLMQHYFDR